MAEHFLSQVEHLVFSIFMPILTKANYCSDGNKQTNKKKTTSKYHCWTICFFRYSCQFWPKPIIAQMETNKQTKKRQLPNNTVERFVFFSFSSQFWHPKKSINVFFFFFRFSSQSRLVNVVVVVRFAILLQPTFLHSTFVFAQRLFCY